MNKLEAIEYLVEHAKPYNEWSGAGMWNVVTYVAESHRLKWTCYELQDLITNAIVKYHPCSFLIL